MVVHVFPLYTTVESSYGLDLEIVQGHLNNGDQVVYFSCSANLTSCDRNRFHDEEICMICQKRAKRGISLLNNRTNLKVYSLNQYSQFSEAERQDFAFYAISKERIKDWYIDNFDIGYGVLSSLITWKQDGNPSFEDEDNISLLYNLAESSLNIYREAYKVIDRDRPERVYIFNGRYAPMRAIVRASEKCNIDYYVHDRGGFDANHYRLFKNTLPHNLIYFKNEMFRAWKAADKMLRNEIGQDWFENKAKGRGSWKSFIDGQRQGQLPSVWDHKKRNLTVFTSSEREFGSIGKEWEDRLFPTQMEGITYLISILNESDQLYIRIHPNQKSEIDEVNRLKNLVGKSVYVIDPDSDVSSYALMRESDLIISFGSTVGIEAVYWGTPSLLLGQCFYRCLNATYNPTTLDELKDMLSIELKPKEKELAYPFAFRMATFGESLKYYSSTGIYTGLFHNKSMSPPEKIFGNHTINKGKSLLKRFLKKVVL